MSLKGNKNISKALLKYHYGDNKLISSKLGNTRFYYIFNNLQRRCNSPKNNRYHAYGKRGIKCLWKNFKEFMRDMYADYLDHCKKFGENNTQIDRIDNNGNYCKSNCKWSTKKEQATNKRNTIIIKKNDKQISLREWSRINSFKYKTVFYRYKYKKHSIKEIFKYLKNKK